MRIKAKVAKVLDNRTIIINAGSDKNVQLGMKFLVSSASNTEVVDPDTKDIIGSIAIPKIKVSITRVDEKYSVAETYEYNTVNVGGNMQSGIALSSMFQPPKLVKKYKTFDFEDTQKKEIEKEKSIVNVGDIAEEVEDHES